LAEVTNLSKSFLVAEAIERYLEVEAWPIKENKQSMTEADACNFVSLAEFTKIVKKYAGWVAYWGNQGFDCCPRLNRPR
jgi:predicted transcriptional regulator